MSSDMPEAAILRALGNPVRRAILDRLGSRRLTGAGLARELDSNTGVMSYHLRELAKAGLVELDETRGRAQFWRLTNVDIRFRDPRQSVDPTAALSVIDARLSGLATAVDRYVERTDLEPTWREAALFSESSLELTVDELSEFTRAYLKLLSRWTSRRPTGRSGARPVRLDLFAFPHDHDGTDDEHT